MAKWPKCLWSPSLLHWLVSPSLRFIVSRGVPCDQLAEKAQTQTWLTDGPADMPTTCKWTVATL